MTATTFFVSLFFNTNCIPGPDNRGAGPLFRLKLDWKVDDDRAAFRAMRKEYYRVRGRWRRFTFKAVTNIEIATFDMARANYLSSPRSPFTSLSGLWFKIINQSVDLDDFAGFNRLHATYANPGSLPKDSKKWINNFFMQLEGSRPVQTTDDGSKTFAPPLEDLCGRGLVFTEGWAAKRLGWYCFGVVVASVGVMVTSGLLLGSLEKGVSLGTYMIAVWGLVITLVGVISFVQN